MKKVIGTIKGKPLVEGDSNLVQDNEILYSKEGGGFVSLQIRNNNGQLEAITNTAEETTPPECTPPETEIIEITNYAGEMNQYFESSTFVVKPTEENKLISEVRINNLMNYVGEYIPRKSAIDVYISSSNINIPMGYYSSEVNIPKEPSLPLITEVASNIANGTQNTIAISGEKTFSGVEYVFNEGYTIPAGAKLAAYVYLYRGNNPVLQLKFFSANQLVESSIGTMVGSINLSTSDNPFKVQVIYPE